MASGSTHDLQTHLALQTDGHTHSFLYRLASGLALLITEVSTLLYCQTLRPRDNLAYINNLTRGVIYQCWNLIAGIWRPQDNENGRLSGWCEFIPYHKNNNKNNNKKKQNKKTPVRITLNTSYPCWNDLQQNSNWMGINLVTTPIFTPNFIYLLSQEVLFHFLYLSIFRNNF